MRAIWVDEGNDPAYHLLAAGQFTDAYVSVKDPRVTLNYLNGIQGRGYHPGLYACSQGQGWPTPTTHSGPAFADWVYDKVQKQIAPGTMGSFPKVMLNCETHDVSWLLSMFKRWRSRSPRRETYYSPEGRQASLWTRDQVEVLNKLNIHVVPQAYRGDMTPHPPGIVDQWLKAGLHSSLVWLFHDAANLQHDWQGFAFSQGRLPR